MKFSPEDFWGIKQPPRSLEILFDFTLIMEDEFEAWHYRGKERFVDYFARHHASDTYHGNIDCNVYATGWYEDKVFGEGTIYLPAELVSEFDKDEWKEIALDFLGLMIRYDLSSSDADMIKDYFVENFKPR